MKRLILILSFLVLLPAASHAAGAGCLDTTGPLTLEKVRSNATGTEIWGCINRSFDRLSSSAAVTGSTNTTIFTGGIYTPRIGGVSVGSSGVQMSSYTWFTSSAAVVAGGGFAVTYGADLGSATVRDQLTVVGTETIKGNAFSVGGSSFVVTGGSATVAYSLTARNVVGLSSGTFNAVFGIGSALTALTAANVSSGYLGAAVIASSINVSGVGPKNTCGSSTVSCSFDVDIDGRITRVSSSAISAAATPVPTRQIFLSGSGTYTTPANVTQIKVTECGGGGGAGEGNSTGNAGTTGGASSFAGVVASSGLPSAAATGGVVAAPLGGSGGLRSETGVWASSSTLSISGGDGASTNGGLISGPGGGSYLGFGGGMVQTAAGNSGKGYGGGGSGGSGSGSTAPSASGAQCVILTINSPAATYPYVVGAAGPGGTGTGQPDGGSGSPGIIIVDELY